MSDDRKSAERKIGWARLWTRAKQIVTTDPTGSDEDDRMVDEEAARVMAAHAGRLKGGLAKVAQLAAYDPRGGNAVLGNLWDNAPAVSPGSITRVIEEDLGQAPQTLFATWDATPLAAASLGQVHAATLHDGTDVVVKVQYPGVAEALRADLDDESFLRKLAGTSVGARLDDGALHALGDAVRGELDYRAEAVALNRFAKAWAGHRTLRFPRPIEELSSARVLTMTRARGVSVVAAASKDASIRRAAALAIFEVTWASPLAHGLLNADPNPGNFLIASSANAERAASSKGMRSSEEVTPDGDVHVWCLDFGCALELPAEVRDADREIYFGLLDEDSATAAERFRMGLSRAGLLARADLLASTAHRDWERVLSQPIRTHGDFHWSSAYAAELAEATKSALALGGLALPAAVLLLWRQRLGAASVIGMLDAKAPFRRVLAERIGTGKRALR